MEKPLKKSYLSYHQRGVGSGNGDGWQKRYFILHGPSEKNEARIDWYHSMDDSFSKPRKTLYVEEIIDITVGSQYGKDYTFELKTVDEDRTRVLATSGALEMYSWVDSIKKVKKKLKERGVLSTSPGGTSNSANVSDDEEFSEKLYEAMDDAAVFEVDATETDAAKRLKLLTEGHYSLCINSMNLTLCKGSQGNPLYIWPYKYIRRYGRNKTSFTFEAGRKCSSGYGLFTFRTPLAEELFQTVQEKTKIMKEHNSEQAHGVHGHPSQNNTEGHRDNRPPVPRSKPNIHQVHQSPTKPTPSPRHTQDPHSPKMMNKAMFNKPDNFAVSGTRMQRDPNSPLPPQPKPIFHTNKASPKAKPDGSSSKTKTPAPVVMKKPQVSLSARNNDYTAEPVSPPHSSKQGKKAPKLNTGAPLYSTPNKKKPAMSQDTHDTVDGQMGPTDGHHEYALYDIQGSSRYTQDKDNNDHTSDSDPYYSSVEANVADNGDEVYSEAEYYQAYAVDPSTVDSNSKPKMSGIITSLKKSSLGAGGSSGESDAYDHIDLSTSANSKQRKSAPPESSVYGQLDIPGSRSPKRKSAIDSGYEQVSYGGKN